MFVALWCRFIWFWFFWLTCIFWFGFDARHFGGKQQAEHVVGLFVPFCILTCANPNG
jgi:hypothetical protein